MFVCSYVICRVDNPYMLARAVPDTKHITTDKRSVPCLILLAYIRACTALTLSVSVSVSAIFPDRCQSVYGMITIISKIVRLFDTKRERKGMSVCDVYCTTIIQMCVTDETDDRGTLITTTTTTTTTSTCCCCGSRGNQPFVCQQAMCVSVEKR